MDLSRLRQQIFLIGDVDAQIVGNKLPSKLQALKVLFFHLRILNSTIQTSIAAVIDEVIVFWKKAQIPVQDIQRCRDKLKKLYDEWRILVKHKNRSEGAIKKQDEYVYKLKNLFDIAPLNVFEVIDDNVKEFLNNQRLDNRVGFIANIKTKYDDDVEDVNELEKSACQVKRKMKSDQQKQALDKSVELISSQGSALSTSSGELFQISDEGPSQPKRLRGNYNIFNERVVATFDRCKVSDRDAVFLVTAICQSLIDIELLNVDINSLVINRSSIRRYRQTLRESKSTELRKLFADLKLSSAVVHWDGKLIPNLLNTETVHRLPVIITSEDKEVLLGVPISNDGTGLAQATAVHETLLDWGLDTCVEAICCDTTPSNLGIRNGAAAILEKLLDKDLLYLPCRHHIFEIVLRYVFEAVFPNTVGPNVQLFTSFQKKWNDLDQLNYKTGVDDPKIKSILTNDKINSIKTFAIEFLTTKLPRDDYREFLELTLVFIGVIPKKFSFRKPGACHHARWMAKAIYVLKMFLFREQLALRKGEESKLRQICVFITTVYIKAWFLSSNSVKAPYHDLQFIKELNDFKAINSHLATVAIHKFLNHLWYLSPELSVIAIFDEDVTLETKSKIVSKLQEKGRIMINTISEEDMDYTEEKCSVKRYQCKNVSDLLQKEIDFFVTAESMKFFERFELRTEFLQIHPSQWTKDESYINALKFVKTLSVVNDCAERGVKLVQDFSGHYSKNEEQLQYVLQLVKHHREQFPNSLKTTNM